MMVQWVCVSDLHAGGLTSLLGDVSDRLDDKETVGDAFAVAMKSFLQALIETEHARPKLILLGDVLDLQFSKQSAATKDAVRFLSRLADTGCFDGEVVATAGNHDHQIWAEARLAIAASAFDADLPDVPTTTAAFEPTPEARSALLSAVVRRAGFDSLDLRYPNIGFATQTRAVVLHHGHYTEGAYRVVSTVKDALCGHRSDPMTVETLVAENASWVDFAWSPFAASPDLETLYQNFLTTAGFRRITREWSARAAKALSEALPLSGNAHQKHAVKIATKLGIEFALDRARDTERMAEVTSLTPSGLGGLRWYLEGPVARQVEEEATGTVKDMTFVLGHTHRPYSLRVVADGFAEPVRVYNTGGWTLNGPRLDNAEGAAVVLIDADLNVASLRVFSTPRNGTVPEARIEMLSNGTKSEANFRERLDEALSKSRADWERLRVIVTHAYEVRQNLLLDLTSDRAEAAE